MHAPSTTRPRRRTTALALGAVAILAAGASACGDDEDDSPDDTSVDPVTSEVTGSSMVSVDSEVTEPGATSEG